MKEIFKNKIFLVLCFCFIINSKTYSQTYNKCVKQITTNPNDIKKWNEFSLVYPGKVNPFLNKFNWGSFSNSTFNSIELNPNSYFNINNFSMHSPYSSSMPNEYSYLRKGNENGPNGVDWHWENGWELMWMNTGYYPNGDPLNSVDNNRIITGASAPINTDVPYIVLYNRYTRTLRVFANVFKKFGQYNNVTTTIKYPDREKMSGILRHIGNNDRTLDQNSISHLFQAHNKNPGNDNMWFVVDLKLGYDPCVCDYTSMLDINFHKVTVQDVKLYGRSISMDAPLDKLGKFQFNDFLNSYDIDNNKSNVMYKTIEGLTNEYKSQLTKYEQDLKDYKEQKTKKMVLDFAINVVLGIVTKGVSTAINSKASLDFGLKTMGTLRNSANPINTPSDLNNVKYAQEFLTKQSKSILAQGADQLSITLIGKPTEPKKPTMPSATFSEMRIDGNISSTEDLDIGNFYTPGSNTPPTFTAFDYPIWNNPTGLFALLEQPKLNFYVSNNPPKENILYSGQEITVPSELYIKLQSPLKYRYNHAVDINFDKTKTYAMFEIILENKNLSRYIPNPQGTFKKGDDVPDELGNFILNHGLGDSLIYITPWQDIENLHNTIAGYNEIIKMHYISYSSQMKIKSIRLKLMNDIYFNPKSFDDKEINTLDVFSYEIYNEANSSSNANMNALPDNSTFFRYFPGYLTIENEVISPTSRYVTERVGNILYIDAEHLIFKGNISVASGYTVEARFIVDAEITDNCEMTGDISIYQKKDFFNDPLFFEVDDSYLSNFCTGQNKKYKANLAQASTKRDDKQNAPKQPNKNDKTEVLDLELYPNPTSNNLFIKISNDSESVYNFKVCDVNGKIIIEEQINGLKNPVFEIDVSKLSSGIYFVKVNTNDYHFKTEKLIIQNNQ